MSERQLHTYALGYRELTGRNAAKVEIYELDTGKQKPRAVDGEFIEGVKVQLRRASGELQANRLPPAPSVPNCGSCDFSGMCQHAIKAPSIAKTVRRSAVKR